MGFTMSIINLTDLRLQMLSIARRNKDPYTNMFMPEKIGLRWRVKRVTSFPNGIRGVNIANFVTYYPERYWRYGDAMDQVAKHQQKEFDGDRHDDYPHF